MIPDDAPIPLGHHDDQDILYHWSPSINHASIAEHGLRTKQPAIQGNWRPPYIAFASSPTLAWVLGVLTRKVDVPKNWDLWMMWPQDVPRREAETIHFDDGMIKEYRVYRNIPAKRIWYVGSRKYKKGGE